MKVTDLWVDQGIKYLGCGKGGSYYAGLPRKWDTQKIGMVQHIPVAPTLESLDNYFCSPNTQGGTHFGIGREFWKTLTFEGFTFPIARTSQYFPTVGNVWPWAQGVINRDNPNCSIKTSPTVRNMLSGEPNGAFLSVENVAWSGKDLLTEPQMNANMLCRAWGADHFKYEINPLTQLWHAEIDTVNRCSDPGWPGELEDYLQEGARRLLRGDLSYLKQLEKPETGDTEMTTDEIRKLIQEEAANFTDVRMREVDRHRYAIVHSAFQADAVEVGRIYTLLKENNMIAKGWVIDD